MSLTSLTSSRLQRLVLVCLGLFLPYQLALAGTTDIASTPLIVSSPSSVEPNIFFVLDDSGSMNWDFLPDHINGDAGTYPKLCRSAGATSTSSGSFSNSCCQGGSNSYACWTGSAPFSYRGHAPFLAAGFNGVAYNRELRYLPPVDATGADYPSQTSANTSTWASVRNDYYNVQSTTSINLLTQFPDTAWCTSTAYTDCLRNGNYVLPGTVNGKSYTTYYATSATGSGSLAIGAPDSPSTSTVSFGPHYYVITPGEYCTTDDLRTCQTAQTTSYPVPSYVRWCSSDANASSAAPAAMSCQAVRTSTYQYPRYPTRFFTGGTTAVAAQSAVAASVSFTVATSGCSSSKTAGISTLVVNGVDLFGGTQTSLLRYSYDLAAAIVSNINAKTSSTGYSASYSSSTVKIIAPLAAGNISYTATLSRRSDSNASCTFTPTTTSSFSGYAAATAAIPAVASSFPGSFTRVDIVPTTTSYAKGTARTDCAGTTCTYAEEMTNFANWWTYYHTRLQAMKSSASRAFSAVSSSRRLGYMSINNVTGSDYLNLASFDTAQRTSWYAKLFAAKPSSSTPLRTSLAKVGRLYAGKYNGTTLNGSTVSDPMQYSCQKNFTILSTDGYWNESSDPVQLDGTTVIGDQDKALSRPLFDGNATSNTLADTAYYYYATDLRSGTTGSGLCNSGSSGQDVCGNGTSYSLQNMRTYTLGLGVSGYMQFSASYLGATSGDYYAVAQGATANAAAGTCTWQTSGSCNWPAPVSNTLTAVDDLWHAAVNGGGTYFSASDPGTLYTGLTSALSAIDVQTGTAAAATTSTPNVTAGNNAIYLSYFKSGDWTGELEARSIDVSTGAVSSGSAAWSAASQLDNNTSRNIYMYSSTASNKLKSFSWGGMSATEQGYFSLSYITSSSNGALSQFCTTGVYCISASSQTLAAGSELVSYLAGARTHEGELADATKYFRSRAHLLGDIVDSAAVYVQGSNVNYTDAGYSAFKSTVASRQGMVYVGANDGMLHAFNASTGVESWAFVPSAVLPWMYKLADKEYSGNHRFMVNSTPVIQDVKISGVWRTVLVGGLGGGGRSYYALDITDPSAPKALWEFTDSNLGLTYGKPEIGKLADGTWVVMFGSGYNNVSSGDGIGRLYVVDAATGALIRSISTAVGSTSTPSGLAHIRAWVDSSDTDNTMLRVYGGDNLGNLWRFDVNANVGAAGYDAQRLASLANASGAPQPITSRPELGLVGTAPVVYVGTGRYLGESDLTDASTQSLYAIKDRLTAEDYGNPRTVSGGFVKQTLTSGTCPSGSSYCSTTDTVRVNTGTQSVDFSTQAGWYVDFPLSYERVNTDPQLVLGTLVVNTNIVSSANVCQVGGSSYVNYFDYKTGGAVSTAAGLVSVLLGNALATQATVVQLPNGKVISISRLSDNTTVVSTIPVPATVSTTRRLSWRDLVAP